MINNLLPCGPTYLAGIRKEGRIIEVYAETVRCVR